MTIDKFLEELSWFSIEKLNKEHTLKNFSCGEKDNELDLFLKEDALNQQEQKINVTHVAVLKNTKEVINKTQRETISLRYDLLNK